MHFILTSLLLYSAALIMLMRPLTEFFLMPTSFVCQLWHFCLYFFSFLFSYTPVFYWKSVPLFLWAHWTSYAFKLWTPFQRDYKGGLFSLCLQVCSLHPQGWLKWVLLYHHPCVLKVLLSYVTSILPQGQGYLRGIDVYESFYSGFINLDGLSYWHVLMGRSQYPLLLVPLLLVHYTAYTQYCSAATGIFAVVAALGLPYH